MRVSHETQTIETPKNANELSRIRVDVVREDVFINGPPRGSVDGDEIIRPHADGQVAQMLPSIRPANGIRIVLELLPRPVAGAFGPAVEVERLVEDGEVVISH